MSARLWQQERPATRLAVGQHVLEEAGKARPAPAVSSPLRAADAMFDRRLAAQTARQALAETGDPDSFGRPLRWMGVATTLPIALRTTCPGTDPPELPCMEVEAMGDFHRAEFRDLARITLPGSSVNSMLCHWFTPDISVDFTNDSGLYPGIASLRVAPTITVLSDVLNDPGLHDPDTGLSLDGKLELLMRSVTLEENVDNGEYKTRIYGATRTCVNGVLTRRMLREQYGLSAAQVNRFFKKPITLSMNATVSAEYVVDGLVQYSVRFVGD
jgi:hypothetical protein